MAKTNWQDPKTSEMRSTHISGLMEAVGKVEDSIGMETVTETNIPLTEVFISSDDRYRIFQAPEGKRNWTADYPPVIKKNGVVISSGFEIDYGGGAIVLNINDTIENTYTTDVTYIKIGKIPKSARFVIGTSTAGWTESDCDYLCDGTDDQVEINNAITALPATGGEIVILDGTYNITAKIDVNKSNVSIRGNGKATILKRMYHSSVVEGVITLLNVTGCKVADLQVDGNKTVYTSSNNRGIYLDSSSNNTVTGNTCNNNDYGIYLDSSSNNTVTGNTCNNNNHGIYLYSSSNENTIAGNTCNNNNYHGIYLYSSSNENTIAGNTCYNNNTRGIYLDSSSNNTVTGNTCNNNNRGICLYSSSNNTITGNNCIRGTGQVTDYNSSEYTIRLYGTSTNYNLISSNNCMGKAVVVEGGTGNTVINNKWNETSDFEDLRTDVGDKTTLTTTDKTNLVNAINEHETQINTLDAEVDNSVKKDGDVMTAPLSIGNKLYGFSENTNFSSATRVLIRIRYSNLSVDNPILLKINTATTTGTKLDIGVNINYKTDTIGHYSAYSKNSNTPTLKAAIDNGDLVIFVDANAVTYGGAGVEIVARRPHYLDYATVTNEDIPVTATNIIDIPYTSKGVEIV